MSALSRAYTRKAVAKALRVLANRIYPEIPTILVVREPRFDYYGSPITIFGDNAEAIREKLLRDQRVDTYAGLMVSEVPRIRDFGV